MTNVLRAAGHEDLRAIYEMAKGTGGGFTNLPPDEERLARKLVATTRSFGRRSCEEGKDEFMFVLEDRERGGIGGTCQIFSKIGHQYPFYSYRIDADARHSEVLGRNVSAERLTPCTDHAGATEVGGLYLDRGARSNGSGALLARSRYLFIAMHRDRFANRTVAELRGVVHEGGDSPFWDGVGRRFFNMSFREVDQFNAVHGSQIVADLMPKAAVLTAMVPRAAREVIGVPHPTGRPAMRMLQTEGFVFDRYIDMLDGGPTMTVETDQIATIRDARIDQVVEVGALEVNAVEAIVAVGCLSTFRCCRGRLAKVPEGVVLDSATARALSIEIGEHVTYVDIR